MRSVIMMLAVAVFGLAMVAPGLSPARADIVVNVDQGATQPLPIQTLAQLPAGQPVPQPAAQLGQPVLNDPPARLIPTSPNNQPAAGMPGQYVLGTITVVQVQSGTIVFVQKPVWYATQPNQAPPLVLQPGVPVYTQPNPPWVGSAIKPQPAPGVVPLPGGFGIPFGRPVPTRPRLFPNR